MKECFFCKSVGDHYDIVITDEINNKTHTQTMCARCRKKLVYIAKDILEDDKDIDLMTSSTVKCFSLFAYLTIRELFKEYSY